MVVIWLLQLATTVLGFLLGLLDFLPTVTLPDPFSLTVPVPLFGASGVAALNTWFGTAVLVACGLAVGRALQWIYKMIPFV